MSDGPKNPDLLRDPNVPHSRPLVERVKTVSAEWRKKAATIIDRAKSHSPAFRKADSPLEDRSRMALGELIDVTNDANANPEDATFQAIALENTAIQDERSADTDNLTPFERELSQTDPRDYIKSALFQKKARAIDNDLTHPWEQSVSEYTYLNVGEEEIALGRVYDATDSRHKLLLTARIDNTEMAIYFENISRAKQDIIMDFTRMSSRLPAEGRQNFIHVLNDSSRDISSLSDDEFAATMSRTMLQYLPDIAEHGSPIEVPPISSYGALPTQEQQQVLVSLLEQARVKLPAHEYQEYVTKLQKDLPITDEAYGRNFKYILSDTVRTVMNVRADTQPTGVAEASLKVETFPVNKLVKNNINSVEDAVQQLASEPVELEPDTRYMTGKPYEAQFVNVDQIIGGPGISSWVEVSTSESRGIGNIYNFIKGFKEGQIDVMGTNQPITLNEVNGKYYISGDGRHRVAALKALGVRFIPTLVSHFTAN